MYQSRIFTFEVEILLKKIRISTLKKGAYIGRSTRYLVKFQFGVFFNKRAMGKQQKI